MRRPQARARSGTQQTLLPSLTTGSFLQAPSHVGAKQPWSPALPFHLGNSSANTKCLLASSSLAEAAPRVFVLLLILALSAPWSQSHRNGSPDRPFTPPHVTPLLRGRGSRPRGAAGAGRAVTGGFGNGVSVTRIHRHTPRVGSGQQQHPPLQTGQQDTHTCGL